MKKRELITGISIVLVIGTMVYLFRTMKRQKMRKVIADAGYETAHDIHYPLKINRPKRIKNI